MKKLITLTLILTAFVSVNSFSQEPTPPQEAQRKGQKATPNQQAANKPPPVYPIPTTGIGQYPRKDNQAKASIKTPDERIATFTGWLVFIAAIQALIFVAQCVAMSIQAKHLRNTVDATKEAAEAANKNAETLQAIEQAYLAIKSVEWPKGEFGFTLEGFKKSTMTAEVENVGKTPAILRKVVSTIGFKQINYPTREDVSKELPIDLPDGCIIKSADPEPYPIRHRSYAAPPGITANNFIETIILCYGCIVYEDIFGKTHETGFCYEFKPTYTAGRFRISQNTELNYHK
ncbi:MAG: hypothetical protein NT140_01340 [Deltaproteobacteria bacterium]|nr:hypothetical protein [Deltaproteobacteria bacterium]